MKRRSSETVFPAGMAAFCAAVASLGWWFNGGAVVICEVVGIAPTHAHLLTLSGPLSLLSALTTFVLVERYARGVE